MKNRLSIAVIIPVYNVKDRINQCVKSLLYQNLDNYKIYLIDDGSTDGSGAICDQLEDKFENKVITFHKENGGVSDARNYGIDHSESDLIAFVDPDDYVTSFYLENLYIALTSTNSDISCCKFYEEWDVDSIDDKGTMLDLGNIEIFSNKIALKMLLYQRKLDFAVWGKLFKRTLFSNLRFPKGKRYEDVPVTLRLFSRSNLIATYNNRDYVYWQRNESMMNAEFNVSKLDIMDMMDDMISFIKKERPDLYEAATCRYFAGLSNVYFQIPQNNPAKKVFLKKIKSVRRTTLLNKEASAKARIGALVSYIGPWAMKIAYSKMKRNR